MTNNELENIDFNSLKLLKILGEERSTKRASERLYLTQSGVSKSLKKLRAQVNDPLFIREGNFLIPTEKCDRLLAKLPALMEALDELYNKSNTFIPSEHTGDITIHINAALSRPLMSLLFTKLNEAAQKATITLHSWTTDSEYKLKQGIVDLGINFYPLDVSKEITQTQIANPKYFLCCHESLPLLSNPKPSINDITQYPFVLTQMPDFNREQNLLLNAFSEADRVPRVIVRSDKIDVCIDTTRQIPSLLIINEMTKPALTDDLRIIDISHIDEIHPSPVGILRSYRTVESPYYQWLNQIVIDCIKQLVR